VYSLNVPLPSDVSARASTLARELGTARPRARGEHTLVVKRLGADDRTAFQRQATHVREALAGAPAFAAAVVDVDYFADPVTGSGPVVYLTVDSPGLHRIHTRLCDALAPVEGIEGEDYTPHVTIARGGSIEAARSLSTREIEPIEWDVSALHFWDAARATSAGSVSLPA
jgi:2'-5' RNA ligase